MKTKEVSFTTKEIDLLIRIYKVCEFSDDTIVAQMQLLDSLFPNSLRCFEDAKGIVTIPLAAEESCKNDIREALDEFDFKDEKIAINNLLRKIENAEAC